MNSDGVDVKSSMADFYPGGNGTNTGKPRKTRYPYICLELGQMGGPGQTQKGASTGEPQDGHFKHGKSPLGLGDLSQENLTLEPGGMHRTGNEMMPLHTPHELSQ